MWRVYYIFTNPSPKRKVTMYSLLIISFIYLSVCPFTYLSINLYFQTIKDWQLALFVLVVLLIDLIFIGVLTAINGGRTQAELISRKEKPSDERGVSCH